MTEHIYESPLQAFVCHMYMLQRGSHMCRIPDVPIGHGLA